MVRVIPVRVSPLGELNGKCITDDTPTEFAKSPSLVAVTPASVA